MACGDQKPKALWWPRSSGSRVLVVPHNNGEHGLEVVMVTMWRCGDHTMALTVVTGVPWHS